MRLHSLAHLDGMPLTARWVVEAVEEQEALVMHGSNGHAPGGIGRAPEAAGERSN